MITAQWRICDVCRIVDYNVEKKMCNYCPMCSAWICDDDIHKWNRRIKAALKLRLEPEYQGSPDYPEMIQKQMDDKSERGIT